MKSRALPCFGSALVISWLSACDNTIGFTFPGPTGSGAACMVAATPASIPDSPGFAPALDFFAGECPSSVIIGNLNGGVDGLPDVAVANNNGPGRVSVLLGQGDGTLGAPRETSVSTAASIDLSAGDLNVDGNTDLMVVGFGAVALLGSGNGELSPHQTPARGGDQPTRGAVVDLNRDNLPDIVLSSSVGDYVEVLLGQGNGEFGAPSYTQVENNTQSLGVGDLNNDQIPDVVTASLYLNTVSVLLGDGRGAFTIGQRVPGCDKYPSSLVLADFNQDQKLDVAVSCQSGNVGILLGNGDGTLQPPIETPVGTYTWDVKAADLNGDSIPDLALASAKSNVVSVLIGTGDGRFATPLTYSTGWSPYGLTLGDLNGDGRPDLVTSSCSGCRVSVLLNHLKP